MVGVLEVVIAALASMVLGALWYSKALFGARWMKLAGVTPKSMKAMPLTGNQAMALGTFFSLVSAYVLAYFLEVLDMTSAGGAIFTGFLIWLGFVMTVQVGSFLWEGKSVALFFLNTSYNLVNLIVMSLIITLI